MTTILLIQHSPSLSLKRICTEISSSITSSALTENEEIYIHSVESLEPDTSEFLAADGYIFVTPANIGYISGAMKHYLDIVYNTALGSSQKKFFTAVIHGNYDLSGAVRALMKICQGMGLQLGYPIVETIGEISPETILEIREAAASLALRVHTAW